MVEKIWNSGNLLAGEMLVFWSQIIIPCKLKYIINSEKFGRLPNR